MRLSAILFVALALAATVVVAPQSAHAEGWFSELAGPADVTLGDLLEGIVLHSFEGKAPFSPETLAVIEQLKSVYGCDLTAADSHKLKEASQ